jgi:hypothetical protein
MAEAESWNCSRAEFRNLATAYPDFPSVRGRFSDGTYIWRPVCPSKAAEEDFNVAATRAALIGGLPSGLDPIFHWHELLSRSGAASQTGTDDIGANQDGRVHPTLRSWNIEILRVLAASAAYCAVQERFALEAAAQPKTNDEGEPYLMLGSSHRAPKDGFNSRAGVDEPSEQVAAAVLGPTTDKGSLEILQAADGKRKTAVTLEVARRFGGVTKRAIHAAVANGKLATLGKRQQRKVLVDSLLKYFPPEK